MSVSIVHVHSYIVSVMCSVVVCFPRVGWTECSPRGCIWRPCQHYTVPSTKDVIPTPRYWQPRVHHAARCSSRRPCWSGSTSDRWLQIESNCSFQGVWSDMRCLVKSSRASGGFCNTCRCALVRDECEQEQLWYTCSSSYRILAACYSASSMFLFITKSSTFAC